MSIHKRGRFYHYEFIYRGRRYAASTRQRNYKAATDIESARRTELAKGDAGIGQKPPAPSLKEFQKDFSAWIDENKENVRTQQFYKTSFSKLLTFKPLAAARLDRIDEPMIEKFKTAMLACELSKSTVNRYLATLRKALRYASRTLKLFDKLPVVTMYPDERQRDFIFSDADYKNWLAIAGEPLRSASILARNSGICRGEMLALQRDCITLNEQADEDGMWGEMEIKRALKRKERRRKLPINTDMRTAIMRLLDRSRCEYLFTALEDPTQPLSPYTLEDQLRRTRTTLKLHHDAGLHTLRHTCLTELGRTTDSFTLQRIAGHARITTTMRYVHVQQDAIGQAFATREQRRPRVPTKSTTVERSAKGEPVYN
jgi:integrase/recombinase XerD